MCKKLIQLYAFIIISFLICSDLLAGDFAVRALQLRTQDKVGWMSPEGINTKIIGVVNITGEFPDIFVQSDSLYPGIFRYQYISRDESGTPVFGNKSQINVPFNEKTIMNVSIFQLSDNSVNMVWLSEDKIHSALFNSADDSFAETASYSFPSFAYKPVSLSAFVDDTSKLNIVVSIPSELTTLPPGDPYSASYIPYMLTGVWRGTLGKEKLYRVTYESLSNTPEIIQPLSSSDSEVLMGVPGCSSINLIGSGNSGDIIAGSYFGTIYYFERGLGNYKRLEIVDRKRNFIRNPNMGVAPVSYPNEQGIKCDILAAGRGGVFFYKFTGEKDDAGRPVYESPVSVLEKNAFLYGGTIPAPSVADVDNDGLLDIVSGNAEGYVILYKNTGTNQIPKFSQGEYLKSNERVIRIEPGYSENPTGPVGARLGYAGINIIDWDNDGVVDMLMNDARGKHTFFKGEVNSGQYSFQRGKPLYNLGIDFRGTQKCRPGVGLLDGKMAYITLDDEDEFHLYWRIDNQNIKDGGKLKLHDGSVIKANSLSSFGTGRVRFELADWDNDGVKDLLLGVDKWHSIPNISNGLPAKGANPSATVLFMKNMGTESTPVFAFPKAIQFREEDIDLGMNAPGISACALGQTLDGSPNLLIADERGRFYLLEQGNMNSSCEVPDDLPGNLIEKTSSSLSSGYFYSPSVVSMENNIYVAYDLQDKTIIQKSDDKGLTWQKLAELDYGKNGTLFVADKQLYLIGSSHSVDNCVILKSADNGITWTVPNSPANGLLLTSTVSNTIKTTPSPVLIFNNRVYKSIEQEDTDGKRKIGFMSASTDNMILRTAWTTTNFVEFDISLSGTGWQDGRVLLTKENNIVNVVSVKGVDGNKAAVINISSDNKVAVLDTQGSLLNIPGGSKDFTLRYDAVSGKYWAITHLIKDGDYENTSPDAIYNTLSLISSSDMVNWTIEKEIFHTEDFENQGFLYCDWLFVDNDIVGASCISWNDCEGSVLNIKYPNFIVSFKIDNFRN